MSDPTTNGNTNGALGAAPAPTPEEQKVMGSGEGQNTLTTRQGHPIYDNQNVRTA